MLRFQALVSKNSYWIELDPFCCGVACLELPTASFLVLSNRLLYQVVKRVCDILHRPESATVHEHVLIL